MAKNKDVKSKEVAVNKKDNTGLPIDLLKTLAKFGVVPRVDHDHVKMQDTSSPRLNWLMGGGIPVGRVTTLSGKRKTGKSTIATIISAATLEQFPDGYVFYFDTENKFDIAWAESLGVDMSRFIFCPIETGEQLINALCGTVDSPGILAFPGLRGLVIDSIRGTKWDAEANATAEQQQFGVGGKMWNKFARMTSSRIKASDAWVLILNGVYKTMDANSHEMIEPGGEGVPFMASLRMRTKPLEVLPDAGVKINLKCLESQVGRNSAREGTIVVNFVGNKAVVNPLPEMSALAKDLEAIEMSGSWYKVGDEKWNGATEFEKAMADDPELFDHVYDAVMAKMNPDYTPPARTYEEFLGEDHADLPLDTEEASTLNADEDGVIVSELLEITTEES